MLYVFDMDGVLFRMDDPLPAAAETIARLKARGDLVRYLTNNSSKSRASYVEKLARFSIDATEDEIMTSAYALGRFFHELGAVGARVYVVGEQGLRDELEAAGMRLVEYDEEERIDYVVCGWDRQFTYAKMTNAHLAIARGAQFIATNRDATYPDAGGRTLPGSGAIVASIETCSGVTPRVIGKPEPYTLELILRSAGVPPEECVVVGDRLDTDIAIGNRVGAKTVLVLTGVSTRDEANLAPTELRPGIIIHDLSYFDVFARSMSLTSLQREDLDRLIFQRDILRPLQLLRDWLGLSSSEAMELRMERYIRLRELQPDKFQCSDSEYWKGVYS